MLHIQSGFGATALDLQQILDAQQGWAVDLTESDSCEVIISDEASREVEANQGTVFLGGDETSFELDALTLDAPSADPRRDVIYIDTDAVLSVETGEPRPYYPDPDETPFDVGPWDVFSPFPHSMHDIDGTVLAEVLVVPGGELRLRDRRMDAQTTMGELDTTRAQVRQGPLEDNDVVRLLDLESATGGGDFSTLNGPLNANNNDINNVRTLTASTVSITSAPSSGNDAVRFSALSNYYRRSGDSLQGPMNANGQDIRNVDELGANQVSANESLDIPVTQGVPDEGMLWWNTEES